MSNVITRAMFGKKKISEQGSNITVMPSNMGRHNVIDAKQPIDANATKEEFENFKGQVLVYDVEVPFLDSEDFHKMLTDKAKYRVKERNIKLCKEDEKKGKIYHLLVEVMEKDSVEIHTFLIENNEKYNVKNIENRGE